MSEESKTSTEKHLSESIDTFMTQVKKKSKKKSLKIIGISIGVVIVVVLLKKDKAMTTEYLSSLEDATLLKDKYDKLSYDHFELIEGYLNLTEKYLDLVGVPKINAIAS